MRLFFHNFHLFCSINTDKIANDTKTGLRILSNSFGMRHKQAERFSLKRNVRQSTQKTTTWLSDDKRLDTKIKF